MIVAGQTIYVATAPEDMNAIWNNSKTIFQDPMTMEMYSMGGISSEQSRKAMFAKHPSSHYNAGQGRPLTPTERTIDLHRRHLHKSTRIDSLINNLMIPSICQALDLMDPEN